MDICTSILGAMTDIGAIGKDKRNTQQGFNYRGVDDVMNALQPALIKNKIFVCPEVLEQQREERTTNKGGTLIYTILKVKYTFTAADGSFVTVTVMGEGMDSADKSSNKAMSAAFKYACFQVFCIPTEEMVDPDSETPPDSRRAAAPPPPVSDIPAPLAKKPAAPSVDAMEGIPGARDTEIDELIKGTAITWERVGAWIAKAFPAYGGGITPLDKLAAKDYENLYINLARTVNNGSR